ncbi:DNA-dependent RNA polymerase II [Marasmius sp. AFHP31]|nr:DNA-dependent RNA polymerase II [Marasmius sp. AFHP31]
MDLEQSGVQRLEKFEKPLRENTLRMKDGSYDKLEYGLIAPDTSRGAGPAKADTFEPEERRLGATQEHGEEYCRPGGAHDEL